VTGKKGMPKTQSSNGKIKVAILDDHQSAVDGYAYRLSSHKNIDVVATANFGDQLEPLLAQNEVDVLVLDVSVPTSESDQNPYPLLYLVPRLRADYPKMAILIISMHKQRTLVRAVMEAGANGYILKDDRQAIMQLGEIVKSVAAGGVYFSEQSYAVLSEKSPLVDDVQLLTKRQLQALSYSAAFPDVSTKQLAKELNIGPSTLRNLLSTTYGRLGVNSRAAAIAKARELGLITPYPPEPPKEN
jgi:DNA-binding NarL/FixJ family response regulator